VKHTLTSYISLLDETGGLATARRTSLHSTPPINLLSNPHPELHTSYPEYVWYPSPLANASHSAERLAQRYSTYLSSAPSDAQIHNFIADEIEDGLGIYDATVEEINGFVKDPATSLYQYADMMSRRSQTGWSTHGHSAADVNIYSSDAEAARGLAGNHENTEVGEFLRSYLEVDVDAVTKELKEKGMNLKVKTAGGDEVSWMGKVPEEGQRLDGQNHLATYGGDFKKRGANMGVEHGDDCGCGH
jgi:alkaline phosphatase